MFAELLCHELSPPTHTHSSLIYSDDCRRGRLQRGATAGPCLHLAASQRPRLHHPRKELGVIPFPPWTRFQALRGQTTPPPGLAGWCWGLLTPCIGFPGVSATQGRTRPHAWLCHVAGMPSLRFAQPKPHHLPLGWATPPPPPQLLGSSWSPGPCLAESRGPFLPPVPPRAKAKGATGGVRHDVGCCRPIAMATAWWARRRAPPPAFRDLLGTNGKVGLCSQGFQGRFII